MAKLKKQKAIEVQKWGNQDELGSFKMTDADYDVTSLEVGSKTKLEQDQGDGKAVIIRRFSFGMNLHAFQEQKPNKQDIFNAHLKGIELAFWKDGLAIYPDVEPRILFDTDAMQYHIFVAARPQRGHTLQQAPQTLKQIVHGV